MHDVTDPLRDFTVRVVIPERRDPRLGRVVIHDSRARLFAAPEPENLDALTSVRHKSRIPVLDQGDLGCCTGVSAVKCLSYGSLWDGTVPASASSAGVPVTWARDVLSETDADADTQYGIGVYSDATRIDPWEGAWPPVDTGSNGASVAKVLKGRGLISGYVHAFSLYAALGLLAKQAVITGIGWTDDMFEPKASGEIVPTGTSAGGHEVVVDELDVNRRRVWIQNQWSPRWGQDGRAWLSWDAYGTLLDDNGDVTSFVPNTLPPPVPTPPNAYETFRKAGDLWAYVERHSSKSNVRMVKAYKAWRDAGSPGGS